MRLTKSITILGTAILALMISACSSTPQSNQENTTTEKNATENTSSNNQAKVEYSDRELRKIAAYRVNPKVSNPAPAASFNNFGNFEIEELILSSANKDSDGAKRGKSIMQDELEVSLGSVFETWPQGGNTLVIQPEITSLRMISGTARFWAGAFAGGSHVTLKLTLMDKSTGEQIAAPIFFRKSNAYGAAWSGGAADRDIYRRAAKLAKFYFLENFDKTVITPSGKE